MFERRNRQPAGAIDLSEVVDHLGDAEGVMRFFVPRAGEGPKGGLYIDPLRTFDPFMFEILLADIVHHGAKAFAYKHGLDEAELRYEISKGLSAELANPTDKMKQICPETAE
jgi:hypothetical protein